MSFGHLFTWKTCMTNTLSCYLSFSFHFSFIAIAHRYHCTFTTLNVCKQCMFFIVKMTLKWLSHLKWMESDFVFQFYVISFSLPLFKVILVWKLWLDAFHLKILLLKIVQWIMVSRSTITLLTVLHFSHKCFSKEKEKKRKCNFVSLSFDCLVRVRTWTMEKMPCSQNRIEVKLINFDILYNTINDN